VEALSWHRDRQLFRKRGVLPVTFRLLCLRSSDFLKRYIWDSPEVKNIVKFYLAEISGTWTTGLSDYELLSYKLEKNMMMKNE
jgi:hypothetical protein